MCGGDCKCETYLIPRTGTWPTALTGPLRLLDTDGAKARNFDRDGSSEVVLIGPDRDDRRNLIVALRFHTLEQGTRAGEILDDALRQVASIMAEAPPDRETCDHDFQRTRFLKTLKEELLCGLCGEVREIAEVVA